MKFLLFMALFPIHLYANDIHQEIAETAKLRQEVELLSYEVESLKKSEQSELDVYIQRYNELTSQILKETFRKKQLQEQIQLNKNTLAGHNKVAVKKNGESWLMEFWVTYEKSLNGANPIFALKLQEKLQKLKIDFNMKKLSYEHALLQTWYILESDLAKAQDTEFILAPMQINDVLYHVEMVRLGRSKGYFRTAKGEYGHLSYDDKWNLHFYQDQSSIDNIEVLLAQFKQQQKTGLFQLPGLKI